MTSDDDHNLDILLLADNMRRTSMLRSNLQLSQLNCKIKRIGHNEKATAYIRQRQLEQGGALPDLILFDFAESRPKTLALARDIAFGEQRSPKPVVLMTSPETESLLESGELDGGEATMFTARALDTFLGKLVGRKRRGFLRALDTLYQYGPILARLPADYLDSNGEPSKMSA